MTCSGQTLIKFKDGLDQEEELDTFLEEIQLKPFAIIMGFL